MATQILDLSDENPQGVRIGRNTTSLVAFHAGTPTSQSATAAAVTTTATLSVAGSPVFGFASSDQAFAIITLVNAMRVALRDHGLMA